MKLIIIRMIRKGSRMGRSNTLQIMSKKLLKIELEFEFFWLQTTLNIIKTYLKRLKLCLPAHLTKKLIFLTILHDLILFGKLEPNIITMLLIISIVLPT